MSGDNGRSTEHIIYRVQIKEYFIVENLFFLLFIHATNKIYDGKGKEVINQDENLPSRETTRGMNHLDKRPLSHKNANICATIRMIIAIDHADRLGVEVKS